MTKDELIVKLKDKQMLAQMKSMAYSIVGGERADDAVQNACIKMYTRLETFDETKAAFNTWAVQIAKNEALQMTRLKDNNHISLDIEDEKGRVYEIANLKEDEDFTDEINHIASKIIETAHTLPNLTMYGLVDDFIKFYTYDQSHKTFADLSIEYNLPPETLRTIFRRAIHSINKIMIGRTEVQNMKSKSSLTYDERQKIMTMK
jgi:RNA polymerase sigma factor (sigma-70 family)